MSTFSTIAAFPLAVWQGAINNRNDAVSRERDWYYYQLQSNLDNMYNRDQMDYAAKIAKEQYMFEYGLESPAVRSQQLVAGGLNKGLMYNAGVAGMQGSVSSPPPATTRGTMPNKSILSPQIASALGALAQMQSVASQGRLNDAMADYYRSEAEDNRGQTPGAQSRIRLADAQAQTQDAMTKLNNEKAINTEQMRSILAFDFELTKKYADNERQIQLDNARKAYDISCQTLVKAINENSLFPQRKEELLNTLKLQTAQLLELNAKTALLNAQAAGQRITNEQLKIDLQVLQATLPDMIIKIVSEASSVDSQAQLLANAVRDYDANWWNNVITDYIRSLGSSIGVGIGTYAMSRMSKGSTPTGQPGGFSTPTPTR